MGSRIRREKKTVEAMIGLYCSESSHAERDSHVCVVCASLRDYAHERLDKCTFGDAKPTCVKCPVHCYQSERREQITDVMRFSGPRMLLRHPYLAIRHLLDERKPLTGKALEIENKLQRKK